MSQALSDPASAGHYRRLKRLAHVGYSVLALFGGTLGAWAVLTPMSGAVVAPATFVSENRVRRVQHPSGGIVSALHVNEGSRVTAGETLLRLDETLARTTLQITKHQQLEAQARAARLVAERDRSNEITFPAHLSAHHGDVDLNAFLNAEVRLFKARATTREGARAQLIKRGDQLRSEIEGFRAQERGKVRESAINLRELDAVRGLFQRNLVPMSRVTVLERDAAQIETARGMLQAQIAMNEARIAETELQIVQIDDDWHREVLRELREVDTRLAELVEKRAAAEDQFNRLDLKSPIEGVVHQMAVNAIGAVLNAAEPVLVIVPVNENLQLEARIQPNDYDLLSIGQQVKIKLHAFNPRTMRELNGVVTRIPSDTTRDQANGQTYYAIRISVSPVDTAAIEPQQLAAGMQADVFIITSPRTPFSYLVQPLTDQFARAFRER